MSRTRLAFWVLGIFLIGVFIGGVSVYEYHRRSISMLMEGGPKAFVGYLAKKMAAELKLDDTQRPAFEAIMNEVHEGVREVRRQARPKIEEIFDQAKPKIEALLRPDQREIFEKMQARHKEHKNRAEARGESAPATGQGAPPTSSPATTPSVPAQP